MLKVYPQPENEADGEVDVGYVEVCPHDVLQGNMCLMCMYKFEDGAEHTVKVILNDGQVVHVSQSQAKEMDNNNMTRMLKTQKLTLALDLDHTLLHAVRLEDVTDNIDNYGDDIIHFQIPGIPTPHVLKLRPGLKTFLEDLCSQYELWIYTHGTRNYAEKIAEIIDPEQKIFGARIISRSDTPDIAHKALKFLFPSCDDSMIIVLDDRIDVWKENYENVFIIEAYHFFNTRAEINNASGKSNAGEIPSHLKVDAHLTKARRVLKAVHERFFRPGGAIDVEAQRSGRGRNVKTILLNLRHEVLRGCNIVFSGVIPLGKPPEVDYLWKLAMSFGATPSMTMDDFPVTHLIIDPRRLGSKKYMDAKAKENVVVINPQWLVDSASEWSRLDEAKYFVTSSSRKVQEVVEAPPAPSVTKEEPVVEIIKPFSVTTEPKAPIKGILSSPESIGTQPKKSVRFAEEEKPEKPKRMQFGNLPKGRVMMKTGPRPAMVTHKGVVASGGSLEFVSKIAQLKARPSSAPLPKFNQVVVPVANAAAKAAPKKDDDDIFRRLEMAEEEEEKTQKPKRKSDLFQDRQSKKQKEDDEDDEMLDDLDDELFND
ncbi:Aste57867_8388 [Aphanomyces stellatus]|uniref:RNA polymerase II subunit A C-terminal domain phosphatase n=1 Tax=Aphanomyces stellatus TaxID=120398 RepID=A0A485KK36_9STRA|nr:hypothetical protein As57867_008356 [Aphanomyces stellatus]VFT85274.1 Aste57867_8388 [Aphanomyces stellatus]